VLGLCFFVSVNAINRYFTRFSVVFFAGVGGGRRWASLHRDSSQEGARRFRCEQPLSAPDETAAAVAVADWRPVGVRYAVAPFCC